MELRRAVTVDGPNGGPLPTGLVSRDGDGEIMDMIDTGRALIVLPKWDTGPMVVIPIQGLHRSHGASHMAGSFSRDGTCWPLNKTNTGSGHPLAMMIGFRRGRLPSSGGKLAVAGSTSGVCKCCASLGPPFSITAKSGLHATGVSSPPPRRRVCVLGPSFWQTSVPRVGVPPFPRPCGIAKRRSPREEGARGLTLTRKTEAHAKSGAPPRAEPPTPLK